MKVMLDTNVLASAAATRGLCADVLRTVLAEHELVICRQIILELQRALKIKFASPRPLIRAYLELIQQDSIRCEPSASLAIKLKDKDDLGILSAAVAGGVDFLVTGDKELQLIGTVEKLIIMSPRQFWQELAK
jgi:putative PIN family toxin of toxin-antitoxin system